MASTSTCYHVCIGESPICTGTPRSLGFCNTMGTASTMASMTEALGMSLPGNATLPAPDTRRLRLAHLTGRRIVEMVQEDLRPSAVMTRASFENAIRVLAAIGGSTNAVDPPAGDCRAGRRRRSTLEDFDTASARDLPLLVNLHARRASI